MCVEDNSSLAWDPSCCERSSLFKRRYFTWGLTASTPCIDPRQCECKVAFRVESHTLLIFYHFYGNHKVMIRHRGKQIIPAVPLFRDGQSHWWWSYFSLEVYGSAYLRSTFYVFLSDVQYSLEFQQWKRSVRHRCASRARVLLKNCLGTLLCTTDSIEYDLTYLKTPSLHLFHTLLRVQVVKWYKDTTYSGI